MVTVSSSPGGLNQTRWWCCPLTRSFSPELPRDQNNFSGKQEVPGPETVCNIFSQLPLELIMTPQCHSLVCPGSVTSTDSVGRNGSVGSNGSVCECYKIYC